MPIVTRATAALLVAAAAFPGKCSAQQQPGGGGEPCNVVDLFNYLEGITTNPDCRAGCLGGTGDCGNAWTPGGIDRCNAACGRAFEPFCAQTCSSAQQCN